jgi:hypothetical protein
VAFVGDAGFFKTYNAQDAFDILQVAGGSVEGFPSYQLADPVVIGNIDHNGRLSSQDAFNTLSLAGGNTVPGIPALPSGLTPPPTGGPDPQLFFDPVIAAGVGSTVTIHLNLNVTAATGLTFESADLAIRFDPSKFTISDVLGSTAMIAANIDAITGTLLVGESVGGATPLPLSEGTIGDIVDFDLTLRAGVSGASILKLAHNIGSTVTDLNGGAATLVPAPDNSAYNPATDGVVLISTGAQTRPSTTERYFVGLTWGPPLPMSGQVPSAATPAPVVDDQTVPQIEPFALDHETVSPSPSWLPNLGPLFGPDPSTEEEGAWWGLGIAVDAGTRP